LQPALAELKNRTGKINYLLHLETQVSNFTLGAWLKNLVVGLKHFTQWNRIVVVANETMVEKFSDAFSLVVPGKSKGFKPGELTKAKLWVSETE